MQTTTAQQSLWLAATPATPYPTLTADTGAYDVVVVGGGVTGLTTALLLKRQGARVAVLEARRVGSGATGNNTAKVSALQSKVYSTIASKHGAAAAADYAAACLEGVELVARLANEEQINCDLRRMPAATYALTKDEQPAVRAELAAATKAGLPVSYHDSLDMPFRTFGAVKLADQLALHPLRYANGLAAAVDGDGCAVFEHSPVTGLSEGAPCRVHTPQATVRADRVVIATHYPILDRGVFFARLEPQRSYAIAATLRHGSPPSELAISAGSPAWSLASYNDLLIVCGQSHHTGERGVGEERYRNLVDFARAHWNVEDIVGRWSAQDPSSYDVLPMIGRYTPVGSRLFTATGFMKWGLSSGTFAARLLADLLNGTQDRLATRFNPNRLSLPALPALARINTKVAKDLVGDHLRPEPSHAPDPAPGTATVRRDGLGKTGVYRAEDDTLHAVSLRCTHLGCLLRFNQAERSWDCSCHGSRFGVDGSVLEGPATKPLPKREP